MIEGEDICKRFEDKILIDSPSFWLRPGGIVGVVGANGIGKTTLMQMLAGLEKPDHGNLRIGETVQLGYSQLNRDKLVGNNSVFEEISQGEDILRIGGRKFPARGYVAMFNFQGADSAEENSRIFQ